MKFAQTTAGIAGVGGCGTRQRRRICDHERGIVRAQQRRLPRDELSEASREMRAPATMVSRLVQMKAVDLDDAGVGFAGQPLDRAADRAFEQPARRRRAHDHAQVGRDLESALMIVIWRTAWPKPWPEM